MRTTPNTAHLTAPHATITPAAQIPLHFVADYCLRCGTMFQDSQVCHIVRGGAAAKYRTIGLCIDAPCLCDHALDIPLALTVYRTPDDTALRTGHWPAYVGSQGSMHGFAKVSMLDNGLAMVGLHRGHVEPWRLSEVRSIGGALGSYSESYQLYSGPGVFPHQVIEVRFYDLSAPGGPGRGLTYHENRFIRGGSNPKGTL